MRRSTRDPEIIQARQAAITADHVRRLFDYDPETGRLTWRVRTNARAPIGKEAGCKRHDGYTVIGIGGTMFLAHRIIWLHVTGEWPGDDLDHIDCDPRNNRFANLRIANTSQNHCNVRVQSNNTSGYKGVIFDKRAGRWVARIKLNGRTRQLGSFDSPKAAHVAYVAGSKRLHGEYGRIR